MDTDVPPDGRVFRYCARKVRGQPCGGRAYIVGLDGEFCVVVALSRAHWEELRARRAAEILDVLGLLVQAVFADKE